MKQRAPIRAPSPMYDCAAISAVGSTAAPAATVADGWMPGCKGGSGCSSVGDAREGGVGIGRDSTGDRGIRRRLRIENDRACARARKLRDVLGVGEEGDRPGSACDRRGDGIHRRRRVAAQLTAETHREFAERHCHGGRRECALQRRRAPQGFAGGFAGAGAVAPAAGFGARACSDARTAAVMSTVGVA